MKKEEIAAAMRELDYLSLLEYREPITDLAQKGETNERILRLGRLIGVMLKQPFAEPKNLSTPSIVTKAYRAWDFEETSLESPRKRRTWQYRAINVLKDDHIGKSAPIIDFINQARYERGFFQYFAQSLQSYLCGDPKIRKKIESTLKAGEKAGTSMPQMSPETIVAAGGGALGVYLVQAIPLLGFVGAPVIAALVVILYSVGIDAFCKWIDESPETRDIER